MKILFVVHKYWEPAQSGTLVYYSNLFKRLEINHEIAVFLPVHRKNINIYAKNKKIFTVPLNYTINPTARFPIYDPHSVFDKDIEERFKLLIEQFQPDVIHFHHLLGLPFSCLEIAIESKTPVIFSIHDFWTLCPRVHLYNGDSQICENYNDGAHCAFCINKNLELKDKLKTFSRDILFTKERRHNFYRWRYQYIMSLLRKVSLITVPSDFVKQIYLNSGISEQKILLLQLSLNLPTFRKEPCEIDNKVRFGYIGSIQNHKGIRDLIQAFVNVNRGRAELLIYGEGDYLNLSKQIRPSESRYVQFKGVFNHSMKTAIYKSMDFLIVPSRCYETFSFVAREALFYKVPIIAPAHSVFLEIVETKKNGLLFLPLNWKSLAKILEDIISQNIKVNLNNSDSKMPQFDEHIDSLLSVYQSFKKKK